MTHDLEHVEDDDILYMVTFYKVGDQLFCDGAGDFENEVQKETCIGALRGVADQLETGFNIAAGHTLQ